MLCAKVEWDCDYADCPPPVSVIIPLFLEQEDEDKIIDWLTDYYGFCIKSIDFFTTDEVSAKMVEDELYHCLENSMRLSRKLQIKNIKRFSEYKTTSDNGLMINCKDSGTIVLTVQYFPSFR